VPPNPFLRLAGNGVWWVSLSNDTKETFVDGYITAMSHVNQILGSMCQETMKNLKPGEQFNTTVSRALDFCTLAENYYYSVDKSKLSKGIDHFYEDARNTRIPIEFSMQYVRDAMVGKKSAKELTDELNGWRDIMNK
jgi:hypothetical protein